MAPNIKTVHELQNSLEARLAKLHKDTKCDLVTLHLYDKESEQLYLPVGVNLLEKDIFYRSVPSMERVAGKVIHRRNPIIADDAEHHPDMTGPFTHREKIKSAAGIPIKNAKTEEIAGVLFLSYRSAHSFDENEIDQAIEWANETATFVEQVFNTNDGKQLRTTLRHEAGFRDEIVQLRNILARLRGILRNVDIVLWLPKKGEQKLVASASVGVAADLFDSVKVEISADSQNIITDVFMNSKERSVSYSPESSKEIFGVDLKNPWERVQLFPIKSDYHSLGVLTIFCRDPYDFTPQDIYIIMAFANLLAVTIENEDRIITLNALHDLGVRLTLSLNLRDVLDEVVRNTCQIIGADISTLHLFDPITQQFRELDSAAVYPEIARRYMERPQSGGGLTSEILKKRRIYVEDIDKDKSLLSTSTFIKKEGIKAYVGTPLVSNGNALGVLYVNFKRPRRFSPYELSLIQIMANYAATAVYRVQLVDQQITVAKIARDIVSNLDIHATLQTILEKTLELLQCQEGSIALYDDVTKELEFRYAKGKELLTRLKSGEGLMGTAALTKKPVRISDVTKNERYVAHVKGTLSELDIPLLIGDKLEGILNIESPRLNAFSPEDENLAMTLASQAAIAIANARLFEEAKTRAEALKSLHEVTSELVSITNFQDSLEKILTQIAQHAQQVLGADLVDIYQYWQANEQFNLPVRVGDRYEPDVIKDRIYKDDVLYTIVGRKVPLYVQDAQSSQSGLTGDFSVERANIPRVRFVVREKIASSASIPLVVEDEVVGVLFVNYRSPQTFSSQQTELIELFSHQAAIAIRNSRLFHESRMRLERLNLVQQVASRFSTVIDIDQILQLAVDGLAKVFDVKQSAVALFDEKREFAIIQKEYLESGYVSALGDKHPMKDNLQIGKLLETKKAIIIDDVLHDPIMEKTRDIMIKRRTLALMVVPIVIDDEVVGSIGVDAVDEKRHFTVEEAELAQTIADQAAAAIRISQQLKNRLDDIKALQDIIEEMHLGDLDAVLTLIAERAIALTGAKHGGVWLVNKNRTALDFGGVANKEQSEQLPPPNISLDPEGEISFSKLVVLNKRSYLSGNVRSDENYKSWYGDTVSELTVPIVYHGRVIGTINVESPKEDSFTEDHRHLLEAMAGQAAIAIQNARLIARMEIVDSIGRKLTSGIRLRENEILELIYQQASQLMDTNNMYIALYDDVTEMIRFGLMYVDGKRIEQAPRKFEEGKLGKTEWIIQNRQPIFHATKAEAVVWYAQPDHQEFSGDPLAAWIGVPMQVGERVLGVIATYHPTQEYLYGKDELDVLAAMAGQAAVAIDNARLYYDINNNLETLVNFAEEVTSSINLTEDEILKKIYQQASQLMDTDNMYIALYDDVTKMIRFDLMYVDGKENKLPVRRLGDAGIGKTEWIIQNKQPIFHATKAEAEAWYAQPGHREFAGNPLPSWIGVPMQVGERVLGVIATYHPTEEYLYTDRDQTILQGISRIAAIALENTRLYKEARGDIIAAKQLSTLGTAIAALQHRINNTFNIIIPNVTRLRSRVDINDPEVAEILDIIERNARYTSVIIARIQEPLKEVEVANININAILDEIVFKKRELWKTRETTPFVQIEFEADESIPNFWGPSGQIAEVFDNLLGNAHKAMPKGGEVRITSKLINDKIEVRVKDTGMGISQEIQTRLFIKPVPSREPGGGSGLGLWLSLLMLQSIGGNVMVESSDQTGTTMLVTIPVNQGRKES